MYSERSESIEFSLALAVIFSLNLVTAVQAPISPRKSDLICGPATWESIFLFYILNYVTHAMSVKSFPGEKGLHSVVWILAALLLPFSGIFRGCVLIYRARLPGESDLCHAARAGALCKVVRKGWRDPISFLNFMKGIDPRTTNIHGQILLPDEFEFQVIQDDFEFSPWSGSIRLANSYSALKSISAVIQLVFACITLYRTRGAQIDKYGYAAFGLTVVQYAVMSLVNLIANVVTPDYPALYMIRDRIMEEAERKGGIFIGTVASLIPSERGSIGSIANADYSRTPSYKSLLRYGTMLIGVLALVAPYAIIGGLTQFKSADSTKAQRGWTMAWLVVGQVYGLWISFSIRNQLAYVVEPKSVWLGCNIFVLLIGAAAIGGLVVVGQMMTAYGYICELPP